MDPNYRATDENWRDVGAFASDTKACILELRARVEVLEAAQQQPDHLPDATEMVNTGWQNMADGSPIMEPAPPAQQPQQSVPPAEIFPVEYADSDGDGIRILMEPADETGRVCWVVRNSRHVNPCHEFPSPEDAYAAHRQAQPAPAPPAPAEVNPLSGLTAIQTCLAQREEILAAFVAKYGFQPEEAIQVEQRQLDGCSYWWVERRSEVIQDDTKPAPTVKYSLADAPPATAEGLVERVHSCIVGEPECGHMQAREVLREVAGWLEGQRGLAALYYGGLLREEAER